MAYPLGPATSLLEFRQDPVAHELSLLPSSRCWRWLLVLDWCRGSEATSTRRAMAPDLRELVTKGAAHRDWVTTGAWAVAQFSSRDAAMDFVVRHDRWLIETWLWWP